jgi:hypothetical protein
MSVFRRLLWGTGSARSERIAIAFLALLGLGLALTVATSI